MENASDDNKTFLQFIDDLNDDSIYSDMKLKLKSQDRIDKDKNDMHQQQQQQQQWFTNRRKTL